MDEIFAVGLVFAGILSVMSSLALLKMGKVIDAFSIDEEPERDRSMWSPLEFTRIFVVLFWIFFVLAAVMISLGTRVMLVMGIVTIAGLVLFLGTALVFSVATFNLMRSRAKSDGGRSPLLSTMMKPALNPVAFVPDMGRKSFSGTRHTKKTASAGDDKN
jgi:uncharacterized membrane protein YgcG